MALLNELALFAGAGGGLLASKWLLGWRTICSVEIDPYRQAVLLARQADGLLDPFPIWADVRDFDGRSWRGIVDVVTAGFPCQPFSVAGRRRGSRDERNLWPDTIRVIREVGPRFAFLENVPGLLAHTYFGTILGDLAEARYDAEWCVLGADDVGAPHWRKRLWILAHTSKPDQPRRRDGFGRGQRQSESGEVAGDVADAAQLLCDGGGADREQCEGGSVSESGDTGVSVQRVQIPDAKCKGLEIRESIRRDNGAECPPAERAGCVWWLRDPADENPASQSFVGRVADGVAYRMDRLAALGDGQVPAVVAAAWRLLTER